MPPAALTFLAVRNDNPGPSSLASVRRGCGLFNWQVDTSAAWLGPQISGVSVRVSINQVGLNGGTYTGKLTASAAGVSGVSPVTTVRLIVSDQLYPVYLPMVSS